MFEVADMIAEPVLAKKKLTVEEYFKLEETSEERHEFYKGVLYTMPNTTKNHNKIRRNLENALARSFESKGFDVYAEQIKLEVLQGKYYLYPDVILTGDKRDAKDQYIVRYPQYCLQKCCQKAPPTRTMVSNGIATGE